MGRATIVAEKGLGLYTIDIDLGIDRRDFYIEKFTKIKEESESNIPDLITRKNTALSQRNTADSDLAQSINILIAMQRDGLDTSEIENVVAQNRVVLSEKQAILNDVTASLDSEQSRLEEAEQKIAYYENASPVLRVDAWCVDYSVGLSGDVGTYEINGLANQVLIAEGGRLPNDSDGALLATNFMSPSQAYFNYAILDGWQKWKPTSRLGIISNKNFDGSVNVTLDSAKSYAQELDINQAEFLFNVPVEYENCDDLVFEVGDRVIVTFSNQEWSDPIVIGFESNPKSCSPWGILVDDVPCAFPDEQINWLDPVPAFNQYDFVNYDIDFAGGDRQYLEVQNQYENDSDFIDDRMLTQNVGCWYYTKNYVNSYYFSYLTDPFLGQLTFPPNKVYFDWAGGVRWNVLKLTDVAAKAMDDNPLSVKFNVKGFALGLTDFEGDAEFLGYYPLELLTLGTDKYEGSFVSEPFVPTASNLLGRSLQYIYWLPLGAPHGALISVVRGTDGEWYAKICINFKADAAWRSGIYGYSGWGITSTFGAEISMKIGASPIGSQFKFQFADITSTAYDRFSGNLVAGTLLDLKVKVDSKCYPEGTYWSRAVEKVDFDV